MSDDFKPFKPFGGDTRPNDFGIQPIGPVPGARDLHDTFGVDKLGNIREGHSTVIGPGGEKIRMPWEK